MVGLATEISVYPCIFYLVVNTFSSFVHFTVFVDVVSACSIAPMDANLANST